MLQGEEIEFALSPKDPNDLTKSFAVELVEQLTTDDARTIYGCDLILPSPKAKATYAYFLTNGSKVYADEVSQPGGKKYRILEIATPEVMNSLDVVRYDKAAEKIARLTTQLLKIHRGVSVECYKTSVAAGLAGNGYTTRGAHESYCVRKDFREKIPLLLPFLVLRQLFCGSGGYYNHRPVISPRQFFVEQTVSEVSVPVPLICLRSESLSVRDSHIRLQVLNGDPTRSQLATFLRFALTSLVIQCIQEGFIFTAPEIDDPLAAARLISDRWETSPLVTLKDGRAFPAVDYLQEYYLNPIERFGDEVGLPPETELAKTTLDDILISLREGRLERLSRRIEWVIKRDLFEWNFEDYFDNDSQLPFPKETANNTYCAVTDSLFEELETQLDILRLVDDEAINKAILSPPECSRGKARTEIVKHFDGCVDDINWDYLVIRGQRFKLPEDTQWNPGAIRDTIQDIQARTLKP